MKSLVKLVMLLAVVWFAQIGCRRSDKPSPPAAVKYDDGPNLEFSREGTAIAISPAGMATQEGAGLPDDVPNYGNVTYYVTDKSDSSLFYSFEVAEAADEVREFYKQRLSELQWQVESDLTSGAAHTISANKDGRTLNVLVLGDSNPNTTKVVLSYHAG